MALSLYLKVYGLDTSYSQNQNEKEKKKDS